MTTATTTEACEAAQQKSPVERTGIEAVTSGLQKPAGGRTGGDTAARNGLVEPKAGTGRDKAGHGTTGLR